MFITVFHGLAWLLIIGISILTLMVVFSIVGKILAAARDSWPFNGPLGK
jgi:hypothetical protein